MSKFCGFPTCVCERELERESMSDERRELIVMLYWIQMRERQAEFWSGFLPLLLFLPLALSFFCLPLHPSEWKYFRGLCLSEPRGKSVGQPFKVNVQALLSKVQLLQWGPPPPRPCRINKRVDFDVRDMEQYFRGNLILNWTSCFMFNNTRGRIC